MDSNWKTYAVLHETLNKVNLINSTLHFLLTNGNRIEGLLSDFIFDADNLLLVLQNVTINSEHFDEFQLVGLDICRWRIVQIAERIDGSHPKEMKQPTFAEATFGTNGKNSKHPTPLDSRFALNVVYCIIVIFFLFLQCFE